MSAEKTASPCNKFQANIFNKTKCQNCFKSRELHLLTDRDMEQAKPVYGGWLCLAPEGTDFDNPMQRSRKWQRRFFILYEHGSLRFALDELPSTLPQGTVNMNLCTDITDAEPRTGQRNALCIATSEQEIFIRGDNKEIINGWSEQLGIYLRTNRQNQKKKRKVEHVPAQEPSPAKMAATDLSFPSAESAAESVCGLRQEDQQGRGLGKNSIWTVADPPGLEQTPAGSTCPHLCSASRDPLSSDGPGGFRSHVGSLDLVASGSSDPGGNNHLAALESYELQTSTNNKNRSNGGSPAERRLSVETTEKEKEGAAAVSRTGRSEARTNQREKLQSCGDITQLAAPPPQRRAKSLDRRTSDTVMTPDLLNFKKGWMVKLEDDDQWKKYWFVLSADSLRYYKDSMAEEASDLQGELDLTKCYNVSEYQVQRNYGFQIHTPKGVHTLSAMTAGIRKNWIQALMKNVHPANAPDVASLPAPHLPCTPPKPDVTPDAPPTEDPHPKPRSLTDRRREGRYKTFDWAELRPQIKARPHADLQESTALFSLELGDLERRRRREERRRRYESMLGFSLGWEVIGDKSADGSVRALSPKSQQRAEEEMEECWKLVERTVFRQERTVPLYDDTEEMERLLDGYRKVEDLKAQLLDSERRRLELEDQLSTAGYVCPPFDNPLCSEAAVCPSHTKETSLKDADTASGDILLQQNVDYHTPSIWLHDADGNFQQLPGWPETEATPLLSPTSDSTDVLSEGEGQSEGLKLDDVITNHQNKPVCQRIPYLETQTREFSSLILETPVEGDNNSLSCSVEQHTLPDQAMVRRFSQEVELLTAQNEALNQRNQEMLNQLTEADREIERLKAELSSRYTEPHHLPEVEQTKVKDLERQLSMRDQQLLEAQTLITSLEESLRGTEALLQRGVPAEPQETEQEKSDCAKKAEGYLLRCFEATEAKLTELERQLDQSELTCKELQVENFKLKEAAAGTEADIRRLNQQLVEGRRRDGERNRSGEEERIQQVIEGMIIRLNVLGRLLEVVDRLGLGTMKRSTGSEPTVVSQLKWEEELWSRLRSEVITNEEKPDQVLLREVTEQMMVEQQMLLFGHQSLPETDSRTDDGRGDPERVCKSSTLKDLDIIWNIVRETASETEKLRGGRMFDCSEQLCGTDQSIVGYFRVVTQMKTSWLNNITSSASTSVHDKLQLMADKLLHFYQHPWSSSLHSAATEVMYCCHISRLQSTYRRELEETKQRLLSCTLGCSNCVNLMEENGELRARLSDLEGQQTSLSDMCCQTDWELQVADESYTGDIETPQETAEGESLLSDGGRWGTFSEAAPSLEADPSLDAEQVLLLTRQVKDLEEQLSVTAEALKDEYDGKLSSVQMQHEMETAKLKAACERGFASMEESHLKVVDELQRRHQQEVECVLVERDRLLAEETAATATAIEAILKAHRLELEREAQRRWTSVDGAGNTQLEDLYRQHSEELASSQQELEVLSQQFSLKFLENGHLVQALDAERKALCQCQQENQDLRTRNQELSGHLAAEITRLCSLAKQDDLPLSRRMDVYEMEITLRVKESEVQSLKQEIKSLKDDLQSTQRDKRTATRKFKDMYAELSILRAKAERETDELRENLRLANRALSHICP